GRTRGRRDRFRTGGRPGSAVRVPPAALRGGRRPPPGRGRGRGARGTGRQRRPRGRDRQTTRGDLAPRRGVPGDLPPPRRGPVPAPTPPRRGPPVRDPRAPRGPVEAHDQFGARRRPRPRPGPACGPAGEVPHGVL